MGESEKYALVGLGNPGQKYEGTRHNVGFEVINFFASHHRFTFRESARFFGSFAQSIVQGKQVILLKPMTFMNLSGESIKSCAEYFGISHEKIVVVCDDITVALGKIRMRMKGASGGHNGLKSVQQSLATEEYPRLRIGIGMPEPEEDLSDYVLGRFTKDQHKIIHELLPFAVQVLDEWLAKGIEASMQLAHSIQIAKTD